MQNYSASWSWQRSKSTPQVASKQSNNNCKWKAKERRIETNNNKPVQTHLTHLETFELQRVEEPRKVCYWYCHNHSWYSSYFRSHCHQCYLIESVINPLSKLIRWYRISFLNSIEIQCNIESIFLQQLHNTLIVIDWRISGRWTACNNVVAPRSIPNTLVAVRCDKKKYVSVSFGTWFADILIACWSSLLSREHSETTFLRKIIRYFDWKLLFDSLNVRCGSK